MRLPFQSVWRDETNVKQVDNFTSILLQDQVNFHKWLIIADLRTDGKAPIDKRTLIMFTNNGIIIALIFEKYFF